MFADDDLSVDLDYFHDPEGISFDDDEQGSYADARASRPATTPPASGRTRSPTWSPRCSAPACGSSCCSEHDYTLFPASPTSSSTREMLSAGVVYRQPDGEPRLPLMYSLRARRV